MPSLRKPWARVATRAFSCAKVRVWEESASTRAVLDGKEETLWKRNETSERLGFFGRTNEGL